MRKTSILSCGLVALLGFASLTGPSLANADKTRKTKSLIGARLVTGTGQFADGGAASNPRSKKALKKAARVSRAAAQTADGEADQAVRGPFRVVVAPIRGTVASVSTKNPGKLYILGDVSASMGEIIGGTNVSKATALAELGNAAIVQWADKSRKGGIIAPRIDVEGIVYGTDSIRSNEGGATSLFGGERTITDLAENPQTTQFKTDVDGNPITENVWFTPTAAARTPMRLGFRTLAANHAQWKRKPGKQHLVLVVHVTDGESTDGDPRPDLEAFSKQVSGDGGQLLVTNIHLSSDTTRAPVLFPDATDAAGFDTQGQRLFEMSSEVPESIARQLGTKPGARMMAFNSDFDVFARVFQAGSSVAQ